MARAAQASGALHGALQQRGLDGRGHRRDRGGLVAADVRHRRAPHQPSAAPRAPSPRVPRRSCSPSTPRSSAPRTTGAGPTVWDLAEPGWLRANFPPELRRRGRRREGHRPRPAGRRLDRQATGLPVVVKGVLRPDDAHRCVEAGARAVWVSNHGGRQLDHAASTASCLAGGGRGGRLRPPRCTSTGASGTPARAGGAGPRGARGVPGAAAAVRAGGRAGREGVERMFAELTDELVETLRLAGCPSVRRVPADLLAPGPRARCDRGTRGWFDPVP